MLVLFNVRPRKLHKPRFVLTRFPGAHLFRSLLSPPVPGPQLLPSTPIPVRLTALSNRTFTFETRTPPTSWFLKRCAGVDKGAARPGHETVGSVTLKQVRECYGAPPPPPPGFQPLPRPPLRCDCTGVRGGGGPLLWPCRAGGVTVEFFFFGTGAGASACAPLLSSLPCAPLHA